MADNNPPPPSDPQPPLPSSTTGRLPSPAPTNLPIKKGGVGKIVVMLSSVAKPPPAGTQAIPRVAPLLNSPPKFNSMDSTRVANRPPPLPAKPVSPANNQPLPQPRLSMTTHVKLPVKTSTSDLPAPAAKPIALSGNQAPKPSLSTPPPLPAKGPEPIRTEPKKSGAQNIPPIKLNQPLREEISSGESIFPPAAPPEAAPKSEGWKSLEPAELIPPAGGLQSLEVFARAQPIPVEPKPETRAPEVKEDQAAPLVAPPLLPPARLASPSAAASPAPAPSLRPPPLSPPPAKSEESSAPPPLPVAPPVLEKAPELPKEKLPAPDLSPAAGLDKIPAAVPPEPSSIKPVLPPTSSPTKGIGNWLTKSTPLILSSSSPKVAEAKPGLKPAVLPKRSSAAPLVSESTEKPTTAVPVQATATGAGITSTEPVKPPSGDKKNLQAKVLPPEPPSDVPAATKQKGPSPLPRSERVKKRRFLETVIFYILFAVTMLVLYFGSLNFTRDTRVEGQIIPPTGMTLNDEAWIVTDFSSLANGVAEDLAKERIPLMQEIQEKQYHVQRAQADVASREERIRLIDEEVQATKDEILAIVKQSRDATQQIWDGEGAQIDNEYQSRFDALKELIANRAKSLKLKYQPDETYQSPEVWANAYRLALYEVPAGVDSVKEHEWLGDQMKQWRDFLKTLDDRKEQLREKAAQIKLAPAAKINDLNAKIDDLKQRSDGIAAEEVPLKAELQQADADLVQAQATDAGLDDKYYKQLDALPRSVIAQHIPLATNGRFTWVTSDPFVEGEEEHHYWIFACATRADGRQYWALHHFSIGKNQTVELTIEPGGFISTKAILRPDLSPEEQEQ